MRILKIKERLCEHHSKLFSSHNVFLFSAAQVADISVTVNMADEQGIGKKVGQVTISETPYGVVFTPTLEAWSMNRVDASV